MAKRLTTKEFIEKAKLIHINRYDYSKVAYVNAKTKIIIICPKHGEFKQTPHSHLSGCGCSYCAGNISTIQTFVEKAKMLHKSKYDYSLVQYINTMTSVTIICPDHGKFIQQPYSHLQGSGCPSCAEYGFNPSKPAYLYYLKITTDSGQILYKIGITNRTVEARFSLIELSNIEIIKQKLYPIGQDALDWEQKLLKQFKKYKYIGSDILKNGNTELFTIDILALIL